MKSLIKKQMSQIGLGKWMILMIGTLAFSLSSRMNTSFTKEQYVLLLLTDHYYLIYFLLPCYLYFCFPAMEEEHEMIILRFGSYFRYFLCKWVSIIVMTFVFAFVQWVVMFASSLFMKRGNEFGISSSSAEELFMVLEKVFDTPLEGVFYTSLYMIWGLCIIGLLIIWLGIYVKKMKAVCIVMILYFLSAITVKIPFIQKLPVLLLPNIMILHHNLGEGKSLVGTILITVGMMCVLLLRVHRRTKQRGGLFCYYKKRLFTNRNIILQIMAILILILLKCMEMGKGVEEAFLYALFAGHGIGNLQIVKFLEMLIYNGIPIYILAVFIEELAVGNLAFVWIRSTSQRKNVLSVLQTAFLFLLLYGFCLILIPTLLGTLLGTISGKCMFTDLVMAVCLKMLDIWFGFLVLFSIYLWKRNVTLSFLIVLGLQSLCILPVRISYFLPFGLSSLSRLIGEGSFPLYGAVCYLSTCILILSAWIWGYGYKKWLT